MTSLHQVNRAPERVASPACTRHRGDRSGPGARSADARRCGPV